MITLTERQRLVLDTIRRLTHEKGYPPTLRELGNVLGIKSTHGVDDHVRALIRKGYLTRLRKYESRSIVVVGDTPLRQGPPMAASDTPSPACRILVYANLVPRTVLREIARPTCAGTATGALVMRGDSLAAHGIRSGDWLFIDEAETQIQAGKPVVVGLDEGTVVRFAVVMDGMVKLHAGEGGAVPILLRPDDYRRAVIATVVGVFRDTGAAMGEAGACA